MIRRMCFAVVMIFVVTVFAMGCDNAGNKSAGKSVDKYAEFVEPNPPSLADNEKFYKNEGAHFELPDEFWYVTGELQSESGTYYFAVHFHKAGSEFVHTRSGYNALRTPDGEYDFRSFGQGMVQTLAENKLKDKIEKFPEDERYPEILQKLTAGESEKFYTMTEEERGLHRGELYISFGKNTFNRVSEESMKYKLTVDTWAGMLDLDMEVLSDPVTFDAGDPIRIGEKREQGYFFPRVKVQGTLDRDGTKIELSGTAWYNHVFGRPDAFAGSRFEIITQRLGNGGAFVVARYFNGYDELQNTNVAYVKPDGSIVRDWKLELEPLSTWTGYLTRFTYPISWKIDGKQLTGTVTPVFENSELMLEQGVGPFWLGPCNFDGKIGGMFGEYVKGEGFCRVVGSEEKPKL